MISKCSIGCPTVVILSDHDQVAERPAGELLTAATVDYTCRSGDSLFDVYVEHRENKEIGSHVIHRPVTFRSASIALVHLGSFRTPGPRHTRRGRGGEHAPLLRRQRRSRLRPGVPAPAKRQSGHHPHPVSRDFSAVAEPPTASLPPQPPP